MSEAQIILGDCLNVLPEIPSNSIDSIVTDPPYEIAMMNRKWDNTGIAFNQQVWEECLRVLKPGGHVLAFGAARTWHRLAVAIEDAGFEIRDSIAWLQAQGFPHGLDVGKAIDKELGKEREVVGVAADFARDGSKRKTDGSHVIPKGKVGEHGYKDRWSAPVTAPASEQARNFDGWKTALKPAFEPIVVGQKPFPCPTNGDMPEAQIILGDCLEVLPEIPSNSIDSIVTDPPYEIAMMNRKWDNTGIAFNKQVWEECLRVLKPGGHVLAFGAARTWHRLAVAIEDAGFEIRDSIAWLQAQGFPHGLDVGKAVESQLTNGSSNTRALRKTEQAGDGKAYELRGRNNGIMGEPRTYQRKEFSPSTDEAKSFDGWKTALKPAFEPIVVGRKPLEGSVAKNALKYGTGAYNIGRCRIGDDEVSVNLLESWSGFGQKKNPDYVQKKNTGRYPTNVVFTHSPGCTEAKCVVACPVRELDESAGTRKSGANPTRRNSDMHRNTYGKFVGQKEGLHAPRGAEENRASAFFPVFRFQSKAPTKERPEVDGKMFPTVKPVALMRWLCRLVTPTGGTVLDPFAGSGTTAQAAVEEGFNAVLVEKELGHLAFIEKRLEGAGIGFEVSAD